MSMSDSRDGERRRTRLLTLTPDYPPSVGGIQILLARLHAQLPNYDHLVVTRGPGSNGGAPWVVRTRASSGKSSLAELNALALREGIRFSPDVVLNGHVVTTPAAVLLGRLRRVPIVTYLYADEVAARPQLTRLAVRASARSIAISSYARDLALQAGARPEQVRMVAPGFDQPSNMGPTAPKAGRPTIVTVARLVDRYKGHDVVLDAVARLRESLPDVHWVVIGTGPLRAELESSVAARGLGANVTFLGHVKDGERDQRLAEAHAFVMPSRLPARGAGGEGFGIVYLEAALHGTPSVAGRVAGAVDAVLDGKTGLLVDPESSEDVARALERLLTDASLAGCLGNAARARARSFTWAAMADQVDGVLCELLQ